MWLLGIQKVALCCLLLPSQQSHQRWHTLNKEDYLSTKSTQMAHLDCVSVSHTPVSHKCFKNRVRHPRLHHPTFAWYVATLAPHDMSPELANYAASLHNNNRLVRGAHTSMFVNAGKVHQGHLIWGPPLGTNTQPVGIAADKYYTLENKCAIFWRNSFVF